LRPIALAILIVAGIAGLITLLSPRLGLGVHEQFVLYPLLGLTRTHLAIISAPAFLLALYAWAFSYAKQPRVFFANTGLTAASLLVALLLVEMTARVIDRKPVFALRNWVAERKALLNMYFPNEYDPVLGWVIKPNQSVNPDNPAKSITTGQLGVRLDHPGAGAELPQGAILAVGDSFTVGDEVGDRGAWPAILQDILGRPVINAADVGWGTDQIVLRTEELLPKLSPSTVVLSVFQDFNGDVDRAGLRVFWSVNKPYFTLENGTLVPHNIPVPPYQGRPDETAKWLLVPSYFYLLQFVTDRLGGWSNWWQMYSFVTVDNDPVAVSCALLKRVQSELTAKGIGFLLVMQYGGSVSPVKRPEKSSAVVACAQAAGIDTLDLWDDLKAAHDNRPFADYVKLWASYDGNYSFGHMSPLGNRLVAERIAAALESKRSRAAQAGDAKIP
jgi:hypothetical protein